MAKLWLGMFVVSYFEVGLDFFPIFNLKIIDINFKIN